MTIEEHDETIAMLRGAAPGGREATVADVAGAMRAGKKICRRRRTLQTVTSGFVLSAGLGVVVMAGSMGGQGTEVVPASPAAPTGDAPAPDGGIKPQSTEQDKAAAAKAAAADPEAAKAAAAATNERRSYADLLLMALGPDFHRTSGDGSGSDTDHGGSVALTAGTPTAKELPDGDSAEAGVMVFSPDNSDATLPTFCKPMVEKGLHQDACNPVTLSNGRVVQVQAWRAEPDEYVNTRNTTKFGGGRGTNLYFERAEHTVVRLTFGAYDQPDTTSPARLKLAAAWVDGYTDKLAEVVADRNLSPDGAVKPPAGQTDHDRDQAILQSALGPSFTLYDGKVILEPGSQKASELPNDMYSATAELSVISDAAYRAVCNNQHPKQACYSEDSLYVDSKHYGSRLLWVSRDATTNEMRGEIAIYMHREDSSWLVANVEVTGRNVTAEQSEDNKIVGQWLESLQAALIKATTDPNVVGTPSTN